MVQVPKMLTAQERLVPPHGAIVPLVLVQRALFRLTHANLARPRMHNNRMGVPLNPAALPSVVKYGNADLRIILYKIQAYFHP